MAGVRLGLPRDVWVKGLRVFGGVREELIEGGAEAVIVVSRCLRLKVTLWLLYRKDTYRESVFNM